MGRVTISILLAAAIVYFSCWFITWDYFWVSTVKNGERAIALVAFGAIFALIATAPWWDE